MNSHSDGNGITGLPSAVCFNEMGNIKKKIWEIKKIKKLRNSSQLHAFSILKCKFREISNDCKSNVSAHQSCTIEVFRLENYRNIAILGSVTYSFEAEKQGGIFFTTLTRMFESDARGDRKLFVLALVSSQVFYPLVFCYFFS